MHQHILNRIINQFWTAAIIIDNQKYFIRFRNQSDYDRQLDILIDNYGEISSYSVNEEPSKMMIDFGDSYRIHLVTTHHLRKVLPSPKYKNIPSRVQMSQFFQEELNIKIHRNTRSITLGELMTTKYKILMWSPDESPKGESEYGDGKYIHLLEQPGYTSWLMIITDSEAPPHSILEIEKDFTLDFKDVDLLNQIENQGQVKTATTEIPKKSLDKMTKVDVSSKKVISIDLETTCIEPQKDTGSRVRINNQHKDDFDLNQPHKEEDIKEVTKIHKVYAAGICNEDEVKTIFVKNSNDFNSPKIWEYLIQPYLLEKPEIKSNTYVFVTLNGSKFDNHFLLSLIPQYCNKTAPYIEERIELLIQKMKQIVKTKNDAIKYAQDENLKTKNTDADAEIEWEYWTEEDYKKFKLKNYEIHLEGLQQGHKDLLYLEIIRKFLAIQKHTTFRTSYKITYHTSMRLIFKDVRRYFIGSLESMCQSLFPHDQTIRKTELNYNKIDQSFLKRGKLLPKLQEKVKKYLENDLITTRKVALAINDLYCQVDLKMALHTGNKRVLDSIWGTFTTANISQILFQKHFIKHPKWDLLTPVDHNLQTFIRLSIHGGIVHTFKKKIDPTENPYEITGDIFDVNSLYPYSMTKNYPCGEAYLTNQPSLDLINAWIQNNTHFIAAIRLIPPKNLKIPPMGFYNSSTSVTKDFTIYAKFDLVLNSEQIKIFLELGYTIDYTHISLHWVDSKPLFSNFIKFIYKKRLEAKKENNPIEKLYKLIMNSLYGKQVERTPSTSTIFTYCIKEKRWFTEIIADGFIKHRATHLGSFILGHSQYHITKIKNLFNAFHIKNHYLAYSDTDSLILTNQGKAILEENNLIGDDLGQLKHENQITEFYCAGPKLYGYKTINENNEIKEIVKSKGVRMTYKQLKRVVQKREKIICQLETVEIRKNNIKFVKIKREIKPITPYGLKILRSGEMLSHKSTSTFTYKFEKPN